MQFLILGLAALVAGLLLMERFARANPAVMAQQIRRVMGVVSLLFAAVFLIRGATSQAMLLGAFGAWMLGWGGMGSWSGIPGRGQKSAGQSSRILTDHLEAELDHDTGQMTGRVMKGMFRGRSIENLKPAELALLWQDCRFTDPQSAQIVEAYLDRVHPTWREDMARGEREMASGPDGRMTRQEALEILGLEDGAGDEDIRRAHKELMKKLHPDRGGSTYLASKINEAKDVLLGD